MSARSGLLAVLIVAPLVTVVSLTVFSLVLQRRLRQRQRLPVPNPPLLALPGQPGVNAVNYESIVTHPIDISQPATTAVEEFSVPADPFFGSAQSAETLVRQPGTPSLSELGSPAVSDESDIFPLEADDFPVVPTHNPDSLVEQQQELAS